MVVSTNVHHWYNYLYSEQELKPWIEKVDQIRKQTEILRIYFNNHYGGKETHCVSEESTASKGNYTGQQRFTTHLLSFAPQDVLRYIQNEGMQLLFFQANLLGL